MTSEPTSAELGGYLAVARAHREHERFHSVLKLEEAVAWRRDSNALKLLADRWSSPEGGQSDREDPTHGAVGCTDLNEPAVVATTGILFMEGETEPAELTSMKARIGHAATRYRQLSDWLHGHMAEEWPRLTTLLTPRLVGSAQPRLRALTRTTAAANAYDLVAHLLTATAHALDNQDLTPVGVRRDPPGAAAVLRTAAWLLDSAAATVAEAGARLSLSDPDWTAFIDAAAAAVQDD
ncbi:hypothetical protein [Actinocatenispora rupis]|uniref:Uncharacterized protein n=1 Tax=Actinocatenispora rupis TaxID=519421 RepID=A0A8J3J225_9ACTN|nr:hypothetical protein [Actinocatenispora rupis]GID10111.1 hypothetical protein Aru02nite_10000 [Actinocatenispora rupis]